MIHLHQLPRSFSINIGADIFICRISCANMSSSSISYFMHLSLLSTIHVYVNQSNYQALLQIQSKLEDNLTTRQMEHKPEYELIHHRTSIRVGELWNRQCNCNKTIIALPLCDKIPMGQFYYYGLTLIQAWISNHRPRKLWWTHFFLSQTTQQGVFTGMIINSTECQYM